MDLREMGMRSAGGLPFLRHTVALGWELDREESPLFLAAPTQNGFSVTLSWEGGEDGTDCGSNATDSQCCY